jgi:hypothetical protein
VGTIYLLNFSQTNNYDFISQRNYIIDCQNACRKRRRVSGNPAEFRLQEKEDTCGTISNWKKTVEDFVRG